MREEVLELEAHLAEALQRLTALEQRLVEGAASLRYTRGSLNSCSKVADILKKQLKRIANMDPVPLEEWRRTNGSLQENKGKILSHQLSFSKASAAIRASEKLIPELKERIAFLTDEIAEWGEVIEGNFGAKP